MVRSDGAVTPAARPEPAGAAAVAHPRWLDVRVLPPSLRPHLVALLLVVGTWAVLLLLQALGAGVDYGRAGDAFGLMARRGWGALGVRLGTVAGLMVASLAATSAAHHGGWSEAFAARVVRRGVLVGVALLGGAFAEDIARQADGLTGFHGLDGLVGPGLAGLGAAARVGLRSSWVAGLAWTSFTALALLPTLPFGRSWSHRVATGLAAAPFAAWLLATQVQRGLARPWESNADFRSDMLLDVVDGLELLLVLFVVWEILIWAELAAGIARTAAGRVRGRTVLVALLALKALWIALGYSHLLPGLAGGNSGGWADSAADGWASWLWGAVLAAALVVSIRWARSLQEHPLPMPVLPTLGVLLVLCLPSVAAGLLVAAGPGLVTLLPLRLYDLPAFAVVVAAVALLRHTLSSDRPRGLLRFMSPGLAVVNVCLLAGFLLAGPLEVLAATIVRLWSGSLLESAVSFALTWEWPGAATAHFFVAPALALVVAVLLAAKASLRQRNTAEDERRLLAAGVLVAALAGVGLLYSAPRLAQWPLAVDQDALGATGDLMSPRFSHLVFPLETPAWERWWNGPAGTVELVTLDTLLTLALALLVWRSWALLKPDRVAVLGFVLLVSTLLAHSSTLLPTGWVGHRLFYLGLVSPVLLQLGVLARATNEEAARRPGPAVAGLALVALLMTVLGYRVLTNDLSPALDLEETVLAHTRDFSSELFLLPLGLAVAAGRMRGRVR